MKYMVMECHLSYAVVLDEEGRFLKVANRHYEVGQTVTEVIEMQVPEALPHRKTANRWVFSFAAMAACLMLIVTSSLHIGQMTFASVYMTINPQVRIDVNRRDKVVGLEGVNIDGNELIEGYEYRKKDLDVVMDELIDRAILSGYLHEGGEITLMLDAESDEWVITHSDTIAAHINEYLNEKISVTIEVTDKKEQPVQPERVIIPVTPEESDYSETDYGEINDEPASTETAPPEESDYIVTDYNDSGYDEASDYEDYDDDLYENDEAYSDYGEASQTDYSEDSHTDYSEDSQTDYSENSQTDYSEDSQTDYNEDSHTDYSEDARSDYDDDTDDDDETDDD